MVFLLEKLERLFDRGELLRPGSAAPNTVDLVRVLASYVGVDGFLATESQLAIRDYFHAPHGIIFVLIDGLGINVLRQLAEDSFLQSNLKMILRSIAPSTTASVITSISTGEYPNQHAVPGWDTYLPGHQLTTTILPFVERYSRQPLEQRGLQAADVFPIPSWLPKVRGEVLSIIPAALCDSVYSWYTRGETLGRGYHTLEQALDIAGLQHLSARPRSYTFLYLTDIDALSHRQGPLSPGVLQRLVEIDAGLEHLAARVRGRATIVVSADHGQVRVPPANQVVLRPGDPLLELLMVPPTGEPRLPIFHLRPGSAARFEQRFVETYGDRFALARREEVEQWFGPGEMSVRARQRFGDYLAVPYDVHTLTYLPENMAADELPIGCHGAFTADEMLVPLIVV